jgi:hypothetical protein
MTLWLGETSNQMKLSGPIENRLYITSITIKKKSGGITSPQPASSSAAMPASSSAAMPATSSDSVS